MKREQAVVQSYQFHHVSIVIHDAWVDENDVNEIAEKCAAAECWQRQQNHEKAQSAVSYKLKQLDKQFDRDEIRMKFFKEFQKHIWKCEK